MTAQEVKVLSELVDILKDPKGTMSRLDERTLNMCKDITELKNGQGIQNGKIEETIKQCASNKAWVGALRWIAIVLVSLLGTNLAGLW